MLASLPISDPTWIFLIVLSLILFAPLVFERLRVPSIVGLILAGVLIGPYGFGVLDRDASFAIFGKVGLYYIMFLASLEMKIRDVMRHRNAALAFGCLSFFLPFVLGYVGHSFLPDSTLAASLLVASMLGSHTLLTHPIVMRWGLGSHRAVGIAVGGTIVTYVLCLLVLAIVEQLHGDSISLLAIALLLGKTIGVGAGILLVVPHLARWFFRKFDESVLQYIFVLGLVFLGAGLMEWIGMEGILGAFVVGLVLNRCIPHGSPLMSHIEFVGAALFVPYFLIGVGMLVNVSALFQGWEVLLLALGMLVLGTLGKWLSSQLVARLFGLSTSEGQLISGLSTARASATLAIALVGHELLLPNGEAVISDRLFNACMVLILGSCIVASFLTERSARRLVLSGAVKQPSLAETQDNILLALRSEKTLVAMTNMALLLRRPSALSTVTAVSVILDDQSETRAAAQALLSHAAKMTAATAVRMQTQCRWAVNVSTGIAHCAREVQATDILIGLHEKANISDAFYGTFATDLIAAASQQLIIYRPLVPIMSIRRLHIVVPRNGEFDPGFHHWLMRIGTLATRLSCHLTFHSASPTLQAIAQTWKIQQHDLPIDLNDFSDWTDCLPLANLARPDHMLIFIYARRGMPSWQSYLDSLPSQIERYFSTRSTLIIVPRTTG